MPPKKKPPINRPMTNWYEREIVQKHMPKQDPYPFENTQIKINSRILVVGTTGSGKTNSLLEYIAESPRTFARVIVIHKEAEALYDALQEGLEGRVEFMTDLGRLPKLAKLRENMDENERILLVVDDHVTELDNHPNLKDYFIYGRRQNITLFCLCQSYYAVPKIIRQQITYLLLFRITSRKDLALIMDDFSSPAVSKDRLREMYAASVQESLNFFKICCTECPLNQKFSHNFTEFFQIE